MPPNGLGLGNLITTNINVIRGGQQTNVVPSEIEVQVDFRLPPTVDFAEFDKQLHRWAKESGEGITVSTHFRHRPADFFSTSSISVYSS